MCWRHVYLWCSVPAGQPLLQRRTVELMVCSSDKTLGLLNLAVGADSNGFLGTHTHTHTHARGRARKHAMCVLVRRGGVHRAGAMVCGGVLSIW